MKYKYKSAFAAQIKVFPIKNDKNNLSTASIDKLRPFIPDISEDNFDLLGFACNAAVANNANLNYDCIDVKTAIAIQKNWLYKAVNAEHNKCKILGCILTSGFSEFGTDKILTSEEAGATNEPVNIVLGGVIWRNVKPDIADYIEESSIPSSDTFLSLSTSWEIFFSDYQYVATSGSRDLKDVIKIYSSEEDLQKIDLLTEKGIWEYEGNKIFRQIIGNPLPSGLGMTNSPAASVKGIITEKTFEEIKGENPITLSNESIEAIKTIVSEAIKANNSEKTDTLISQSQNKNVTIIKETMKLTKIAELTDSNIKECVASEITDLFNSEIKKASDQWATEKSEKDAAAKAVQDSFVTLKAEHDALKTSAKELSDKFEKLNSEVAAAKRAELFSSRMSSLDEKFTLSSEDRKIIASDITDLDEKQFDAYMTKMETLLASKIKTKESKASEEKAVVENAVTSAKAEVVKIPVTSDNKPTSMREKFAKSFSIEEGFSVKTDNKR